MEALRAELAPLERQREDAMLAAEKRTNTLTWVGLGMMSVQFGILARLTWWEYSWDIMEPGECVCVSRYTNEFHHALEFIDVLKGAEERTCTVYSVQ